MSSYIKEICHLCTPGWYLQHITVEYKSNIKILVIIEYFVALKEFGTLGSLLNFIVLRSCTRMNSYK